MAEESIVIDVQVNTDAVVHDLAAATKEVERLKLEQKELTSQYKSGQLSVNDYVKALAANKKALDENQRAVKSNTAVLQVAGSTIIDTSKSLDEQRVIVNAAQKAYASLSGEAKEMADQEGGLRDQIKEAVDALKEQEHAIGDDSRNVGNYTDSLVAACGKLGLTKDMLDGAANSLEAMGGKGKVAANILKTMAKGLDGVSKMGKSAASSMTTEAAATDGATASQWSLNAAMDANPVGALIIALTALIALMDTYASAADDAAEAERQHAEELKKLKDATNDAKKALHEYINDEKYANLTNKEKERYDALKARLELLKKEKELLDARRAEFYKIYDDNMAPGESWQYNMGIALRESKYSPNRAKANEAEIEYVNKTLQRILDKTKEVGHLTQEQIDAAVESRIKAIGAWEEARIDAYNLSVALEHLVPEYKEVANSAIKLQDVMEPEEEGESIEDMVQRVFGLNQEAIDYFKQLMADGYDYATAKSMTFAEMGQKSAEQFTQALGSLSTSLGNVANSLSNVSDENQAAARAAKAFSLVAILTNEAQSISEGGLALAKGIKESQSVPFPYNLAAVATTVATVAGMLATTTSNFVSAKNLFTQAQSADAGKYATGGIVGGNSFEGDRMTAHVNSGEMVLTRQQQTRLFEMANSSMQGDYSGITDALIAAISSMPAPVMQYDEFTTFQNNVTTYKELAAI